MTRRQWSVFFLFVLAVLPAGLSRARVVGAGPQPRAVIRLQPGFVPAPGSRTDAKTGLPTRVLHRLSGVTLVLIPAGEFFMGSPESEQEHQKKERRHRRIIHNPFYLGETEVTVAQYRRFVTATRYQTDAERGTAQGKGGFAATPDGDRTWTASASWQNPFPNLKDYCVQDDHPVIHVSWNDASAFCKHFGLRLPSEAQWEYAARAGSQARFPWGESEAAGNGFANLADLSTHKRFPVTNVYFPFDDGAALINAVGRYKPNAWMLYDMMGNVEEWVQDTYDDYPDDGADESAVEGNSGARLLRGGSWLGNATTSRAATRIGMAQDSRRDFQGFRVAATVESVRRR